MNNTITAREEKVKKKTEFNDISFKNNYSEIIELMMENGMLPDNNIEDEIIRLKRQQIRKKSYHNTLLLLENYRTISWLIECFPEDIAEELEVPFENVDNLVEKMELSMAWGNRKLEWRIKTLEETRLMMDRLNEALTVLKKKPNNGERLYSIIYYTYIYPEKVSHKELLIRLDLSTRHYYRLRKEAISVISVRLWSTPSANVNRWMEMLTLLEELN